MKGNTYELVNGVWQKTKFLAKKATAPVVAIGSSLVASTASALDTAAAITAIQSAGTDADTVGGAVVVLIAGLIVFGIVFGLMRKA